MLNMLFDRRSLRENEHLCVSRSRSRSPRYSSGKKASKNMRIPFEHFKDAHAPVVNSYMSLLCAAQLDEMTHRLGRDTRRLMANDWDASSDDSSDDAAPASRITRLNEALGIQRLDTDAGLDDSHHSSHSSTHHEIFDFEF
jgi:hypothetical protein